MNRGAAMVSSGGVGPGPMGMVNPHNTSLPHPAGSGQPGYPRQPGPGRPQPGHPQGHPQGHLAPGQQPQQQFANAGQGAGPYPQSTGGAAPPPSNGVPMIGPNAAMSGRLASANAAVTAFQSVIPHPIQPVPKNKPIMARAGMPYMPGGDIADEIRFPIEEALPVVDELTAQKSSAEFSAYINRKRKRRQKLWKPFWEHRLEVNRRILEAEDEAFNDAQDIVAEDEFSGGDTPPRRNRKIQVPYIYHNAGSFDIPLPKDVTIPDPQTVARMQQAQMAAAMQLQHQQHQQRQEAMGHPDSGVPLTQDQLNAQMRAAARMRQSAQQRQNYRH